MSDDLLQSVHKWLEKNGYPLEYDVQHAFDEAGFGSVQGFHIPDMKTDAVREIDVTASVMRKRENAPEIHCVHVVECKNNGNAWVAFTRPTSAGAKFCIEETIGNTLGRRGLVAWSDDKEVQALDLFRQRCRRALRSAGF